MKPCVRCKEIKPLGEFSPDKRATDGRFSSCRECKRKADRKYWAENKDALNEKQRLAREENIDHFRERERKYYHKNKHKKDRDKQREWTRSWRANNKEKVREINRRSDAKKKSTPMGKLNHSVSREINNSLRRGAKAGRHWEELVGYTVDELKRHLEKKFKYGMTWDNYGSAWHIDHKIPISAFNFEKPEDIDFCRCWSLKNLRPLWAKENISKHAKLTAPFQPSLLLGQQARSLKDAMRIPGVKSYSKRV